LGPNPTSQSPTPNPKSPIPNPQLKKIKKIFIIYYFKKIDKYLI